MRPSIKVAETTTADGARLTLHEHDGQFTLRVGGRQLMSTTATESESRMADLACAKLRADAAANVLIGGLGFGFTLKRTLERVGPNVRVHVAELIPEILEWNRVHMQTVNGPSLDDPRVSIVIGDVVTVLANAKPKSFDAVLLDVDNGPAALVARGNEGLYTDKGLRVLTRALSTGARAVFWSASEDRSFLDRLKDAGFRAEAVGAKAYPQAKRDTHVLFVGDWSR